MKDCLWISPQLIPTLKPSIYWVYPPAAGASLAREHSMAQATAADMGTASGDTSQPGTGALQQLWGQGRSHGLAFLIKFKAPLSRSLVLQV